jgi:hypothetical protein
VIAQYPNESESEMRSKLGVALLAMCLIGCSKDTTGTGASSLTGTYVGDYTTSLQAGVIFTGTFQITQNGSSITGTLTSNAARSGSLVGTLSGSRITGTITFTDSCHGSASTTVDVVSSGSKLVGNYTADDCLGHYTGGYSLTKQ